MKSSKRANQLRHWFGATTRRAFLYCICFPIFHSKRMCDNEGERELREQTKDKL